MDLVIPDNIPEALRERMKRDLNLGQSEVNAVLELLCSGVAEEEDVPSAMISMCEEVVGYIDTLLEAAHHAQYVAFKDPMRFIECCDCAMTEEFPADMPRSHSQSFTHVRNMPHGYALYECHACGACSRSEFVEGGE